jgi:TetR/AcrR family transcriptional regulator, transcriptional repressor for nem operon
LHKKYQLVCFMKKSETTRRIILEKAFSLIYTRGYQTTSIDDIIATTQVTKGAFFYHFKTKDEMGVAILKEILYPSMHDILIKPIQNSQNPNRDIYNSMKQLLFNVPFLKVEHGCPLGNLTQEMSPWNTEFSQILAQFMKNWQMSIQECIKKGIAKGLLNETVQSEQVAYFIISSYWGIRNIGKLQGSNACYTIYLKELKQYLHNLK